VAVAVTEYVPAGTLIEYAPAPSVVADNAPGVTSTMAPATGALVAAFRT
jgi:hypothetical protein